jgi:hypothetical protein
MKIVAKPIEMICWFDTNQGIHPIRFRISLDDGSNKVINVEKVITRELEKLAGNTMWVFDCQSNIDGFKKQYQLKYELSTCKWILFKI